MNWLDATAAGYKADEVRKIIIARDNDEGAYSNVWLDTAAYKIEEFEYACYIYHSQNNNALSQINFILQACL